MARETKAAKQVRIGMLLAEYDAANNDKLKAERRVEELKEQIKAEQLPEGPYGDWTLAYSNGRTILDQKTAKELLTQRKIPVPTKTTDPSIVVKPKVA